MTETEISKIYDHTEVERRWYDHWEKGRLGAAVVGTYTRGGTVVTVGTTDDSRGRARRRALVRC